MKKSLLVITFLVVFVTLFYNVGSFVVNGIMSLIPMSAQDWFPLIKFVLWFFTFSFNFLVTMLIVYFTIFIAALFVKK